MAETLRSYRGTVLLLATDPAFGEHDTGAGHPERPERLEAIAAGIARADLGSDLVTLAPRRATRAELERVHPAPHLDYLESVCARSGHFDADTPGSPRSWEAVTLAVGAGLAAVAALEDPPGSGVTQAAGAFLAVRPPGHHARATQAMGFCLVNNVAIVAAELRSRGARVAIVDIDAHHGNGTQEIFYRDPGVLYISFHEWPLYPGTGRHDEMGEGAGLTTTCNLPLPAGATGDVYLRGMDHVVEPLLDGFAPDWVLISAGFDAHREDPLTGLALSAGDYGLLVERLIRTAPAGRAITFLEGGYSLSGLRNSVQAILPVLAGGGIGRSSSDDLADERPTSGGPGARVIEVVEELWRDHLT